MAVLPTVVASAKGELEFATISLQRQVKIWRYSSTPKCTLELLCSTPEAATFHTLTSHKTELWYSPNGKAIVAVFAPIGNSVASYTKGSNNSENAKPIMLCWKRVIDEGNSTTVQMQKVSSEDSSLPGSTNRSFSMVSAYRLPPSDEDLAAAIVTMPLAGSDMDNNIPVDDVFGVALDGRSGLGLTGEQGQLVKMAKRHSFASFGCIKLRNDSPWGLLSSLKAFHDAVAQVLIMECARKESTAGAAAHEVNSGGGGGGGGSGRGDGSRGSGGGSAAFQKMSRPSSGERTEHTTASDRRVRLALERMPDRDFAELSQQNWFGEAVRWIKAHHDPESGTQQLLTMFAREKFKQVAQRVKNRVNARAERRKALMTEAELTLRTRDTQLVRRAWERARREVDASGGGGGGGGGGGSQDEAKSSGTGGLTRFHGYIQQEEREPESFPLCVILREGDGE